MLQNIQDIPDAYSIKGTQNIRKQKFIHKSFPFSDWLFSLNSVLAYGLEQIAFLVLFVWGPCLGNHRKHFQEYFQRLAGHTVITLTLFLAEHCTCLFMSTWFMYGILPQWQELRAAGVRWCQFQQSQLKICSAPGNNRANSCWGADTPSPDFSVLDDVVLT